MSWLETLHDTLWGWHVIILIIAAGVYFSVASGFFQIKHMKKWLSASMPSAKKSSDGISHFQALTAALGGSIGTGNIVGVAAAITVGGAGALFWMWVSSLFGMMTVFAENLLSAKNCRAAGALGYIEKVGKPLAWLYAAGCCLSSLGMGSMAQTNACAAAMQSFGVPTAVTAAVLGCLVFSAARGGLKHAVKITDKLVPAMTLIFFASSLAVLWVFKENIPRAVKEIFTGAFNFKAGAGGAAGALIAMREGVSRGVFTNEAGLGSSAFAYDGVKGKTPTELGCLGIFQVFADTIVMCTVTGLCILCCRSPMLEGAALTFFAYRSALGAVGGYAVCVCTALFAVATVITWSCYGRESLFYLTRGRGRNIYAVLCAFAAVCGCVLPLSAVFQLGDAMNGLMAVPNIIALFICRREILCEFSLGKQKREKERCAQNFQNT